jgi:transglutaminase-like putative cysteine protease
MAQLARTAANDSTFVAFVESLGSIQALQTFVRDHFVYRDESEEIVRAPDFMLADMGRMENGRTVALEGDCDDISTFIAAAARVLGIPARFVAIRYTPNNPNFEHVFTEVYSGGQWNTFDATVEPGTEIRSIEEMTEDL